MAKSKTPAPDTTPATAVAPPAPQDGSGVGASEVVSEAVIDVPNAPVSVEVEVPPTAPAAGGGDVGGDTLPTHHLITARRDGFRRAGRAWSVAPTRVDVDDFSAEELAALRAEPMLTVAEVTE